MSKEPVEQTYDVQDGVNWVNGKKVPASRKVKLTEAEALYDLSLERIVLAGKSPAVQKEPKKTGGDDRN